MPRRAPTLATLLDASSALVGRGGPSMAWKIVCDGNLQHLMMGYAAALLLIVFMVWRAVSWVVMDTLHWNLALSLVALIFNIFLCAFQMIALMNLHEFSKDHLNQFDVETSIKRMVVPERILQMILTIIHLANGAWLHFGLQLPIAAWHVYCVVKGLVPVKAVLGRNEEFERNLRQTVLVNYGKAVFYLVSMVLLVMRVCPLIVAAFMQTQLFKAFLKGLPGFGSRRIRSLEHGALGSGDMISSEDFLIN